jgi:hypothetical protein
MTTLGLSLQGPCPRSTDGDAHTWRSGDSINPISFGEPDHGVTVYLGRCRSRAVPLLAVVSVSESFCGGGVVLEVQGTPR